MTPFRISPGKLALLGSLYFAQGLPFGFFHQALPVLMRERSYSLVTIGLSSLLAAPWGLKFLWAPLIDRYGHEGFGRRRSFIIPLQLASVVLLLAIAGYGTDRDMGAVLAFVFVVNLLAATQDVATDGLALDVLHPSERGAANGIQVAGFRVGMIAGGGVLLMLVEPLGWSATFGLMALLLFASTLPVTMHREQRRAPMGDVAGPGYLELASALVRRPGSLGWLAMVFFYKFGHHLAQSMLRPYLVDTGADKQEIGLILGVIGSFAGLLGAVTGGALIHRLGRRRALVGFAVAQTGWVVGYAAAVVFGGDLWTLGAVSAGEHFVSGMATVALFTVMMDACRPESAATDYTIQASLVVAATAIANVVGGFTATGFGYGGHFVAAAITCAAAAHLARASPLPATDDPLVTADEP